ncbi:MAG: precorrin-8X methylmutase [Pseudomonadota bacterium]
MSEFHRFLVVDWSANNTPKTGSDSIWIADADCQNRDIKVFNPATRSAAMEYLEAAVQQTVDLGQRLFAGFDFAFGYPADSAFLPGKGAWRDMWKFLHEQIEDHDDNLNNRFEIGGKLNRLLGSEEGPFWGHPHQHEGKYEGLGAKKPDYKKLGISEKRQIDDLVTTAQPVWKLAYTGSVGSQALLGIARLQKLRTGPFGKHIAIWPFETRFAEDLSKPVIVGELYPSLFEVSPEKGEIKDAAQVRTVAEQFCEFVANNRFAELLDGPRNQLDGVRDAAVSHEAWMVGFADKPVIGKASGKTEYDYVRDPEEIYRQSFATVEGEASLDALPKEMRPVATRLIHSCGMIDIVDDLEFSNDAVRSGIAALNAGKPIYCDVEMVKAGIIGKFLPDDVKVTCTLNDKQVPEHARNIGNTRSAAAVDLWDELEGSIVVIGNAPTALFRLLEKIQEGAPKPELVIGIPVGFVGAVESKQALAENRFGLEFITVHGRRGGSAMASSVVNALAGGLR